MLGQITGTLNEKGKPEYTKNSKLYLHSEMRMNY